MSKPEVFVRIVSHSHDANQVENDLLSISNHGAIELEDERGLSWFTEAMVRDLAKDWSQLQGRHRTGTRLTTNIVLSIPVEIDPGSLREAALAFARQQFGSNHQYVVALHTGSTHPHIQLTVLNFGHNGRRLHVKDGDPQAWREIFASELERCGVEAQATLRTARGA